MSLAGLSRRLRGLKKYSLLVILPLVCGTLLLAVIGGITRTQIDEYGRLTAQYFQSESGALLRSAEQISRLLSESGAVAEALRDGNADPFAVCGTIQRYVSQSDAVGEAYLCSSAQSRIYSSRAYWEYSPHTSLIGAVRISELLDGGETGWHLLNGDDALPYYVARIPAEEGETVLIVTLDRYPLLRFMRSIDARGCALFNDEGFITPLVTSRRGIDWRSADAVSELLGAKVECFYRKSGDYTYMVAVEAGAFRAPLRMVALLFGLYFAVIAAAGAAYLSAAARRERRRFAAVVNCLPEQSAAGETEDELFANIKTALHRSHSEQRKAEDAARANAVRLILKNPQDPAAVGERCRVAGIPEDAEGYCVVALFADDYSDMFFDDCDELQNIDLARLVFRIAMDEIADGRMCISGAGLGRLYASVFCFQGQDEPMKLALAIVRGAIDFIEDNYGLNLAAAVSGAVADPCRICDAYAETERLRGYMRVVGIDSGIVTTENLTDTSDNAFDGSYISQLQILANAVQAEKFDLIPAMVDSVLAQYITSLRRHFHVVQSRIATMTGLLSEAVLGSRVPDADLPALSRSLREAQTASEVSGAARRVFGELSRCARGASDADPVNRACAYIRAHGADAELSAPRISESVGVSTQHLARLFRKKLGCTVAEYLHAYRVDCGKRLLAETELSVSAVAQQVGYNGAATFTYNFRRIEGVTPGDYREMARRRAEK